jgi:hypothetical protein
MSNDKQHNDTRHQNDNSELRSGEADSTDQASGGRYSGTGTGEAWRRQGQHTGRGPKNYQRSNERITEDVHERLTHIPQRFRQFQQAQLVFDDLFFIRHFDTSISS